MKQPTWEQFKRLMETDLCPLEDIVQFDMHSRQAMTLGESSQTALVVNINQTVIAFHQGWEMLQ